MTIEQRKLFADKFADLGNYAAAGMVFGQFVLGLHANVFTIQIGIAITLFCYFEAYLLSQ
jgi:hypothetical protein